MIERFGFVRRSETSCNTVWPPCGCRVAAVWPPCGRRVAEEEITVVIQQPIHVPQKIRIFHERPAISDFPHVLVDWCLVGEVSGRHEESCPSRTHASQQ